MPSPFRIAWTPVRRWAALYAVLLAAAAVVLARTREGTGVLADLRALGLVAVFLAPVCTLPSELGRRARILQDREVLGQAVFRLWLVNVLLGTLVGSLWLFDAPAERSPWVRLYVAVALVSSVGTLALLPGAGFLAVLRWVGGGRRAALAVAAVGTVFLGLLYTDTIVYRLLRYHFFSSAVVNVALTPGSGDSIILGSYVWTTAASFVVACTAAQFFLLGLFARRLERLAAEGRRPSLLLRPRVVLATCLLPSIVFSQTVQAAADVADDREMLRATRALPVHPRVRLGRILDPEAERLPALDLLPDGARLDYPHARPTLEGGQRPNFLVLVLDSWRRDMFDAELTPNLDALRDRARVFTDHLSGGNGTRYGLFTLFYGLHGSYWFPVLAERRPPVLVDSLEELGYDIRVFSSASMNFPEFLDTAWSTLPRENVVDRFPDGLVSWEKDELLVKAFDAWLDRRAARSDSRPFFTFVLIDAPHQPYNNPGGPYAPVVEELDYIELGRTTDGPELPVLQEKVLNTYKNSVHHADGTAGAFLDRLERAGLLDDTVCVVTGDHGEEFFECGHWGHTSAFSPEQVQVPFLIMGPGVEPGVETRPTSHLDVSGSLLELLGADPARRGEYTLGESLFDPPPTRCRVVAGWSDIGLWTPSGIFDLPLQAPPLAGWSEEIECYDRHWNPVPDLSARCRREAGPLEEMARECQRFLRVR